MALLLGIDLGTSYFKVGLFSADGMLRGLGRVAVATHVPAPGRSELHVDVFWRTLRKAFDEALAQAGAEARDVSAMSYSSQASTFVLLDAHDRPLTPLVLWTDTRGEPVEPTLAEFGRSEAFQRHTGFAGISGQAAPAKWRWFQRAEPRLWAAARRVQTVSDYVTYALTGRPVGDASTAAFLGTFDLVRAGWWPEALHASGVDAAQLSQPLRPGTLAGHTGPRACALLGLPEGIPFAVGALDHHAAALGAGLGPLGDVSISIGTVLAALVIVERVEARPGCFHGLHVDGRSFYRLAFDPAGAGQVEAFWRAHVPQRRLEDLLEESAAPRTPEGRAVREILEAACAAQAALVNRVLAGARPRRVVATGGGTRSAAWNQLQAEKLGVPVVTPATPERACLGAAIFAAVAAGRHASVDAAAEAWVRPEREFTPGKPPGGLP